MKLAAKALDFLINQNERKLGNMPGSAGVIGMRKKQIMVTSINDLMSETDFE